MEKMEYYELLPGGDHSRKRWEAFLPEFRRGLAEAIGTFTYILVSCLGVASKHTSETGTPHPTSITIVVFIIG